jgi:hypothetical protein
LIVLPWSQFWERNYFAQSWPLLAPLITNAFFRGGVTGLGFVNLLAGVADLAPIFTSRADHLDSPANSQVEP